jgi:sirohydrochlorin cobaltochelatase
MVVAGDHAHNDMAGDEGDSWKTLFKAQGLDVDYIMKGLGEMPSIRAQFIEHAQNALEEH